MFRIEQAQIPNGLRHARKKVHPAKVQVLAHRLRLGVGNSYLPGESDNSVTPRSGGCVRHNRKSGKHFAGDQESVRWLDQDC